MLIALLIGSYLDFFYQLNIAITTKPKNLVKKLFLDFLAENMAFSMISVNIFVYQISLGMKLSLPVLFSIVTSTVSSTYVKIYIYQKTISY